MAEKYVTPGVTDLSTLGLGGTDNLTYLAGAQTINNGLTTGVALTNIIIQPGFTGTTGGGSAGSLISQVTGYIRNQQTGGAFNYSAGASSCARYIHLGPTAATITGGTITRLEQASGAVNVNGSTVVPTAIQSGGSSSYLFYATGTPGQADFQSFTLTGGNLLSERGTDIDASSPTITIAGGSAVFKRLNSSTNLPTIVGATSSGRLNCYGGSVDWQGGNINILYLLGGSINLGSIPADITIGTLVADKASLARSNLQPAGKVVTISSSTIYAGVDDTIYS